MEIEKILEELYSYSMFGIKLGLENIKKLCKELGNPQNNYKIIHIAGTNGKGSTATTIESILLEKGYNVGKYTSPHILKFNERIRANGKDITDTEIGNYFYEIKKIIEKLQIKPTFFEVTTALMFKYFSDLGMEYVVLETGMGGKFDATNVVTPIICVITNVSLDHCEYLGKNIYDISKEKAGIIKENAKVIVACNDNEFLRAISEKNNTYTNVLEKYSNIKYRLDYEKFSTDITTGETEYNYSLFGEHQVKNFLCAYEVAKILNIDDKSIKKAVSNVEWQCRFEKYIDTPMTILDGAHNEAGMIELVNNLKKGYKKDEVVAIVSILKDKEIKKMLSLLEETTDKIILTAVKDNPRGVEAEYLYNLVENKNNYLIENDIKFAYEKAKKENRKIIVVCGSFYTLSRFKEEIRK